MNEESPKRKDAAPDSVSKRLWIPLDFSGLWPPGPSIIGLALVVTAIVAIVMLVTGFRILSEFVWQVFTAPPKDFEDTSRRLIAIGIIVAAPFAVWRIIVSHWQARAAQGQAVAAARQADTSREEHYTTLFITAVQQLGTMREVADNEGKRTEPNTEARLGAIYALERIAQDSERDHWPIMETLCAYVRKNAGPPLPKSEYLQSVFAGIAQSQDGDEQENSARKNARPHVDVQAALTVIGRRRPDRKRHEDQLRSTATSDESYRLDLTRTNLSGVNLDGLDFDHARFDESTLLFVQGRKTLFRFAVFASVDGGKVDFTEAHLDQAVLNGSFYGGDFTRAVIDHAEMSYGNFHGTRFTGAKIRRSTLDAAFLRGAWMSRVDLTGSDLTGADLRGCYMLGSDFGNATFTDANLAGAFFADVDLSETDVTSESLAPSFGTLNTKLAQNVARPAAWLQIGATPKMQSKYTSDWLPIRRRIIKEAPLSDDESLSF